MLVLGLITNEQTFFQLQKHQHLGLFAREKLQSRFLEWMFNLKAVSKG